MTVQLSSDILEQQFGPTAVQVLYQKGAERIIATHVTATGQLLELSWVTFQPAGIQAFPGIHRVVLDGTSMGAAFKSQTVPFRRNTRGTYAIDVPGPFKERFDTEGQATAVELSAQVGAEAIPYADILEVYSPAVVWPDAGQRPDPTAVERLMAFAARLAALN